MGPIEPIRAPETPTAVAEPPPTIADVMRAGEPEPVPTGVTTVRTERPELGPAAAKERDILVEYYGIDPDEATRNILRKYRTTEQTAADVLAEPLPKPLTVADVVQAGEPKAVPADVLTTPPTLTRLPPSVLPEISAVPKPSAENRFLEALATTVAENLDLGQRPIQSPRRARERLAKRIIARAPREIEFGLTPETMRKYPATPPTMEEARAIAAEELEQGLATELGEMLGALASPPFLLSFVGGQRVAFEGIKLAARRGIPFAKRFLRLASAPETAPIAERALANAVRAAGTAGTGALVAETVETVGREGRLPTPTEAAAGFVGGTVVIPPIAAAAPVAGALFARLALMASRPGLRNLSPRIAQAARERAKARGQGPTPEEVAEYRELIRTGQEVPPNLEARVASGRPVETDEAYAVRRNEEELGFARRVLGTKKDATRTQIDEAYRRGALRFHPDRPGGGDADVFAIFSDAAAVARAGTPARPAPTPRARPDAPVELERPPNPFREEARVAERPAEAARPATPEEVVEYQELVRTGKPVPPDLAARVATETPVRRAEREGLDVAVEAAAAGPAADIPILREISGFEASIRAYPEDALDAPITERYEVLRTEIAEAEKVGELSAERAGELVETLDKIRDVTPRAAAVGFAEPSIEPVEVTPPPEAEPRPAVEEPAPPVEAPPAEVAPPAPPEPAAPRVWESLDEVPEGVETKRLAGGRRQEIIAEPEQRPDQVPEAPPVVEAPAVEVPVPEAVAAEPPAPEAVAPQEPAPPAERAATEFEPIEVAELDAMEVGAAISVDAPASQPAFRGLYRKQPDGNWLNERTRETAESAVLADFPISTAIAPTAPKPEIPGAEVLDEVEAIRPAAPREPEGEPTGVAPAVAPEGPPPAAPERPPARRPVHERPGAERPGGEAAVQPGGVEEGPEGVAGVGEPHRGGIRPERPGAGARAAGERAGAVHAVNYRVRDPADLRAERSPKQKAIDNIGAIRLLKEIEASGQPPTRGEQEILARYAGWGFAKPVFEPSRKTEFTDQAIELRELLTDDEYTAARASSPNAHYTDPAVVTAMWDALRHMGYKGGRLLEPGMGAGYFLSLIPEDLAGATKFSGVELDDITGRIAKLLFPKADIRVQGFEEFQIPDGYYLVGLSNVPFGEYRPFDPKYQKHRFTIHNYFFAKTLDKVQPGGVVAFITSRYTMDAKSKRIREYLAERADLLGAIRLPNTAFKKVANTEVTTDIIFLRKRYPGEPAGGESWTELGSIDVEQQSLNINEYFVQHPEMMLGTMELTGTQYGANEPTLAPKEGNLADQLAEAIDVLPRDVLVPSEVAPTDPQMPQSIQAPDTVKEGAFTIEGGKLVRRQGGQLLPARNAQGKAYTGKTLQRIKALIGIRDAARAVLTGQLSDASDADIHKLQAELGKLYDRFVKRFGPINKKSGARRLNLEGFRDDPDVQLVANLENIQVVDEAESFVKADLFTQRVLSPPKPIQRAEKPEDALLAVLNERGRVDLDRMAEITGFSKEQLVEALEGQIFEVPETGRWEDAGLYLSGNVRTKLAAARGAAQADPRYKPNVEALEGVQPKDLPPSEIEASLGAPWIPPEDVAQFIADLVNDGQGANTPRIRVAYAEAVAAWSVNVDRQLTGRPRSTKEWGTDRRPFPSLVQHALNMQEVQIRDRQLDGTNPVNQEETLAAQNKFEQVKKRFRDWLWEKPERATRLHRVYNDDYNNTVPYKPDGSHMTFPGMAAVVNGEPFEFRPHQPDGIWRILQTGNTLLAHAVGSGKTFIMAAAGMEAKRIGLAHKVGHVVPNHIVEQFAREFLQLYPSARILVATKKDLAKENRRAFIAKVATNEWDAVIMAHSSFTKIPVSPAFEERFIRGQLAIIEDAIVQMAMEQQDTGSRAARSLIRTIEVAKKRLDTRLRELEARDTKDDVVSFEEMGVDMLFVDEAHNYKNLFAPTRMRQLAGADAQKAMDMFMKVSYLHERTPGRGVVFATGTPLSRSIVEMYTLLRYLAPEELASRGMAHLDAWAAGFAETVTKTELRPEGGFRQYTRLALFKNAPELSQLFLTMADVQTADMLKLPTPAIRGGQAEVVVAPMSDELAAYQTELEARADAIRRGVVRPDEDNMLLLTHHGDRAALDMRLIDSSNPDHPDSKVNVAVDRIFKIWDETAKTRRTQMAFIDWSTPKKSEFNIYDDMKAKLIARGVPEKEIAFIHDAKTQLAREELFARVRVGSVRILFGSTAKMGEGTNIQHRMIAQHQLDAPWNPSWIEQREGRILRQGNTNEEVEVIRYVTEGSFDGYRWQTLQRKARFIAQMVRAEVTSRTIEDVDGRELNYAEVMAITTGNPLVMEKAQVDNDVLRLSQLARQHVDRQFDMRRDLATIPERRQVQERRRDLAIADQKKLVDTSGDKFSITLQGRTFTDRKEAGTALMSLLGELHQRDPGGTQEIGRYAGLSLQVWVPDMHAEVILAGEYSTNIGYGATVMGAIQGVDYLPKRVEMAIERAKESITELARREKELKRLVDEPFDQSKNLEQLLARQKEIDAELDLDKPPPSDAVIEGEADPNAIEDPQEPELLQIDAQQVDPGDPSPTSLSDVRLEETIRVPAGFEMPGQEYGSSLFELARQLETPARYKHLRNAYGRFQPEGAEGRVEVQDVHDNFALAHEIAHALDYRLSGDVFPSSIKARFGTQVPRGITEQALRTELALVAQTMRPVPGGPNQLPAYRRKHTELMADFYSLYLLDPAKAMEIAPNVTEAFERRLASRPKMHDAIQATMADRTELPAAWGVPEIRPVPQPTTLTPTDIEGDYTAAVKSLVKAMPRMRRLMTHQAKTNSVRWEKQFSDRELEDMGAAVENIGNLRTGEPVESILANLTPAQKKTVREYRVAQEHLRQSLNEFLRDVHGDDYIAYVEDYLLHVYVRDRKRARTFAARWTRKVPSAKARRFPTLEEAVEAGFVPLTQNIAELHKMWAEMNWRGAINQRFVFELKDIVNDEGLPVLMKPKDAPPDWVVVDHPAIRRVYARRLADGTLELWPGGAAVDPEVYKATKQVFEQPLSGKVVHAVEYMNAFARKAAVTLTFFHHSTLTGSATGALARTWNPLRGIVLLERGLRGGIPVGLGFKLTRPHLEGLRLMENADFVRDLFLHGLGVDPIPDAAVGIVNRVLREWEAQAKTSAVVKHVPGLDFFPRALRRFLQAYDHPLWNRYHPGLKAFTYWDVVQKEIEFMPDDATATQIREMKELAAELINDAYGGQEWEAKFWLTPQGRQLLYAGIAYPDWTFSNINIALKTLAYAKNAQARRFSLKYWRNMFLGLYGLIVAANWIINKTMVWDNEPGHGLDIDVTPIMQKMPWTSKEDIESGRRWYVRPAKQFRQVLSMAAKPVDILGAKLSPFLQMVVEQVTGHQTGQVGWEMPWARKELSFYESLGSRGLAVMEKFVPFSIRGNNFAMTFPMTRGMSWYKAQKAYEDIIRAQVDPSLFQRLMPSPDADRLKKEIDDAARLNGLDPEDLYKQANTMVRTRYYGELARALEDRKMDKAERAADILTALGVTRATVRASFERREVSRETLREAERLVPAGPRRRRPSRPRRPQRPSSRR